MLPHVIAIPAAKHRFLARVKHHSFDALNMKIAKERVIPAAETEQRHRRGDPYIYAKHARLDVADKFSSRSAAGGENRRPVAVFHSAHDCNCLISPLLP